MTVIAKSRRRGKNPHMGIDVICMARDRASFLRYQYECMPGNWLECPSKKLTPAVKELKDFPDAGRDRRRTIIDTMAKYYTNDA